MLSLLGDTPLVTIGPIIPNQFHASGKTDPFRNLGFLSKKNKKQKEEEEEEEEALKESNLHVTKLTRASVSRVGDRNGEGLEAEETVRGSQ